MYFVRNCICKHHMVPYITPGQTWACMSSGFTFLHFIHSCVYFCNISHMFYTLAHLYAHICCIVGLFHSTRLWQKAEDKKFQEEITKDHKTVQFFAAKYSKGNVGAKMKIRIMGIKLILWWEPMLDLSQTTDTLPPKHTSIFLPTPTPKHTFLQKMSIFSLFV